MIVKEMIDKLKECDPNSKVELIQEEELECEPDLWDDEKGKMMDSAVITINEWDLHSHGFYLFVKR